MEENKYMKDKKPEKYSILQTNFFWWMLAALRVAMAFWSQHFYQPDEWYQGQVVGYGMVYGKAELTWEWLGETPIRNAGYPSIFALFFQLAKTLGIDSQPVIVNLPYILESFLYIGYDHAFFSLLNRCLTLDHANFCFWLYLTNPMLSEVLPKPLTNNVEGIGLLICLVLFLRRKENAAFDYLIPAILAIAVMIRITSLFGASVLIMFHLLSNKKVLIKYCLVGIPTTILMLFCDRFYYRKWVITPLNFILFNVVEGKSALFGVEPATEYLFHHIPAQLLLLLPFFLIGLIIFTKNNLRNQFVILPLTILVNILVYSGLGHKESRFLLPIIALMIMMGGYGFQVLYQKYKSIKRLLNFILCFCIIINALAYVCSLWIPMNPKQDLTFMSQQIARDGNKQVTLGLYPHYLYGSYDLYLHKTNIHLVSQESTEKIFGKEILSPFQHLERNYLNDSSSIKLDYLMVNTEIDAEPKILDKIYSNFNLVTIKKTSILTYPLDEVTWKNILKMFSNYDRFYLFKRKQ